MKTFWLVMVLVVGLAVGAVVIRQARQPVAIPIGEPTRIAMGDQADKTPPAPSATPSKPEMAKPEPAKPEVAAPPPAVEPAKPAPVSPPLAPQTSAPLVPPAPTVQPAESKPTKTKPVETKPVETTPAETKPAETKPVEARPAEVKPAEPAPIVPPPAPKTDPAPALAPSVPDSKPVESKPAESKPVDAAPAPAVPAPIDPAKVTTPPPAPDEAVKSDVPQAPPASAVAPAATPPAPGPSDAPPADGPPVIENRADGSMLIDGKYEVKGDGSAEKPYEVTWEMLISAQETYQPKEGKKLIPGRLAMLDNKHVRVTGYIAFPLYVQEATEMLSMLNQWDGCCIGVPPTPYDAIEVRLKDAVTGPDRFATFGSVEGRFGVKPYVVGDWLVGLYTLDEAKFNAKVFTGS